MAIDRTKGKQCFEKLDGVKKGRGTQLIVLVVLVYHGNDK